MCRPRRAWCLRVVGNAVEGSEVGRGGWAGWVRLDVDFASGQYEDPTGSAEELVGREPDRDGRPHVRRDLEGVSRGSARAAQPTPQVNGTVEPQGDLRSVAVGGVAIRADPGDPAVLQRQVRELEVARQQRLRHEGRHLLPGHRVAGAVVAASAATGDAEARQLLDVTTERV